MINSELAINAIKRQNDLMDKDKGKYLIHKYLQSDCHYLTTALSQELKLENVIQFYLSKSGRIIHSAIEYDTENVLDILGKRTKEEINDFYDSQNNMFGLYESEGYCKSMVVNIKDFNHDDFYVENTYDKNKILEETKEWFENL